MSTNTQANRYQIPKYDTLIAQPKSSNYCLIIPVINEGDRIKKLLTRICTLNLPAIVDVIIVDGGSTDGSLNRKNLDMLKVNSLLLKRGSGKLGAQLRCAYAYALDRGYMGIITIDGNNKDDPAYVPNFIAKLSEGYDFVQASRFIAGGIGENTPKVREWAIRFIHAPVLSIASGFYWTDTTQGFRGYSRKILTDTQVGIFRDVFSGYELLPYLNYIAPRLNFRCIEIPTARSYPQGEMPSKISVFKGNLELLKILLLVAFGNYNVR